MNKLDNSIGSRIIDKLLDYIIIILGISMIGYLFYSTFKGIRQFHQIVENYSPSDQQQSQHNTRLRNYRLIKGKQYYVNIRKIKSNKTVNDNSDVVK